MHASLYIEYIHIYWPYETNTSLEYIYIGAIYMFSALIQLLLCILSSSYMCLCMLLACCPTSGKLQVDMEKAATVKDWPTPSCNRDI